MNNKDIRIVFRYLVSLWHHRI